MRKEKNFKEKTHENVKGINFMNISDRRALYSIVGFIGGMIAISMILPQIATNRNFFIILGGLIAGWIGYKIATR